VISYCYSSCVHLLVGATLIQNSLRLCRLKSDRDAVWQDYSLRQLTDRISDLTSYFQDWLFIFVNYIMQTMLTGPLLSHRHLVSYYMTLLFDRDASKPATSSPPDSSVSSPKPAAASVSAQPSSSSTVTPSSSAGSAAAAGPRQQKPQPGKQPRGGKKKKGAKW